MKTFALLMSILITGIAANAHALPINVALGGTVTISNTAASGTNPSSIVDGNATYTSSDYSHVSQIYGLDSSGSGWWQIELDSIQRVDQIAVYCIGDHPYNTLNYTINTYTISYKAEASDTWTQIVDFNGPQESASVYTNTHDLDTSVYGQYFRFEVEHSYWRDPVLIELELNQLDGTDPIDDDDPEPESTVPEPTTIVFSLLWSAGLVMKKIKGNR